MSVKFRHDHACCGGGYGVHEGHLEHHHQHGTQGAAAGKPFAFASSPRHFERPRPFTIEHIAIDLTLDFAKKSVRGSATLRIRRVDPEATAIELDAVAFAITKITFAQKRAKYVYDGRKLTIDVPREAASGEIVVAYSATPRKGLYFLEPDEHVPSRPRQAWTQCQEEDGRHFFPCHDKPHVKMTTETRITVPEGFYVLSNGELASRTRNGEDEVFHWKMTDPHPSYLLTIVAGEFDAFDEEIRVACGWEGEKAREERAVPLTYFVPKGREEDGRRTFARTKEMVGYFSELTGVPYPWNKYAQVVVSDFIFGGMENTTATTMYEHILLDARAALDVTSDDLIAHELAHQWFGDFVTCRDWSEGWLNEGFATFMEHVWRRKLLGQDEYEYGLRADLGSYLGEAGGRYRRPIVCQDYDAPLDLFDRHLYEKGGLVLHVLSTELGGELFWKGVSTYLRRHARSIVETRDLVRALEEVSGRSLGRRVEELVYRPGHPEVEVEISWEKGVLSCGVKQTHGTQDGVPAVFEIPLVLVLRHESGDDEVRTLRIDAKKDSVAIPCAERPRFVVVDPDMRILGAVTVKAPADMLRRQLEEAKTARGRWLAAQALGRVDDPLTIEALAARLRDDSEFWGVRAEVADALGHLRVREAFDVLASATSVSHPKVRRAVVAALGQYRIPAAVEALKPRALRDESYLVEAEAARSLGRTRQPGAFDVLIDVMDRPSWADVIAAGAMDGLAALRDDRALAHLYARTRYGHPSRVRRAAALAIPKISTDRRAREHLEELLDDSDAILRIDVVRALSDLGDARSRPALRARVDVELDPRVRRRIREVLRDLGGERKQGEQLKDELEKLRDEHAELKARIAKLEARADVASGSPGSEVEPPSKPPTKGPAPAPRKAKKLRKAKTARKPSRSRE